MDFLRRVVGSSSSKRKSESASGNGVKAVCGTTNATNPVNKYSTDASSCPASSSASPPQLNVNCRDGVYPYSEGVRRFTVPDSAVPWDVELPNYAPAEYTAPAVAKGPVWADAPVSSSFVPKWNQKDGKVNRKSFVKDYEIVDGKPINPIGRTGIVGRGLLGKWGPNHAADPIVTRWKTDAGGVPVKHPNSMKPILQFVCIQRRDSGEWAIPGGMVDDDEEVSLTLKREFGEEALNSIEAPPEQLKSLEGELKTFFSQGSEIYKGYVDDPRNTDNAWMETVAVNFHDADGTCVGRFPLAAGDDAGDVQWRDVDASLKLYASHASFIEHTAQLLNAHWY